MKKYVFNKLMVPFELPLLGVRDVLICEKILRLLPGKRCVLLGKLGEKQVVAKLFIRHPWWQFITSWFSNSVHSGRIGVGRQAQKECRGHEALRDLGILTPDIVQVARSADHIFDVVVFSYQNRTEDSREVWNSKDAQKRRWFIHKVLTILAKQHAKGIYQEDLHPSNFIISGEDIYTIDVASVKMRHDRHALSRALSLKNVSELLGQLAVYYDDSVGEFLKTYASLRGWVLEPGDSAFVKKFQTRFRRKREKKYLEKIFRHSTRYVCQKSWRRFVACARAENTEAMRDFLKHIDQRIAQGEVVKAGNSNTLVKVEIGDNTYVVKRYNIKNFTQRLKRWLKTSRAVKSWVNAQRLYFHHVDTPRPVALLEKKWGLFRSKVYYISEYIDGVTLNEFLSQEDVSEREMTRVLQQIQALFQAMLTLKLSHGDLKATNFLVADKTIYLTDLDVMRKHVCQHRLKKALMRDKARFLENWRANPVLEKQFSKMLDEVLPL